MQEFLSKDPFTTGRLAIARLTTGEMSAETMLQWLQRARPEAKGVPCIAGVDVSWGCAQFPLNWGDHFPLKTRKWCALAEVMQPQSWCRLGRHGRTPNQCFNHCHVERHGPPFGTPC